MTTPDQHHPEWATLRASHHFIAWALEQGYKLKLHCAEDGDILYSGTNYLMAIDALVSVDWVTIKITNRGGVHCGWVEVVNDHSFEPAEFVSDYSTNGTTKAWSLSWEKFYKVFQKKEASA